MSDVELWRNTLRFSVETETIMLKTDNANAYSATGGFCDFYKLRALSLTVMCMWQLGYVIWTNQFRKNDQGKAADGTLGVVVNATVRCFFWWNSNSDAESDLHAWWAPAVKSVGEMQTAKKVVEVPLSDGGKIKALFMNLRV